MSEASPPPAPPAGWYPDPERPSEKRYWDGERWTELPAPPPRAESAPAPPPPPRRKPDPSDPPPPRPKPAAAATAPRRSQWGAPTSNETEVKLAVLASIIPLVGVIVAIFLLSRKDPRGFWAIGMAILGVVLLLALRGPP